LFGRYLTIGALVFCVEIAAFGVFVKAGLVLPAATSFSFLIATSTHFTLNRFFNFRNFDRTMLQQARTYVVIAGVALIIQNAVVLAGVHLLGLTPVAAKIVGIALNIPLGFLGHRYLTFGAGIVAVVRRYQAALWDPLP